MSSTVLTKDRYRRAICRPMPTGRHRDPAIFRRVRSAISRKLKALAEARRMARAYDELAAMSDPELHDIGISRADIPVVVSGTYHRSQRR
jgi:uncharacterized protein YjiS (DUF1127 family)